jgi:general secretion pathway protein E
MKRIVVLAALALLLALCASQAQADRLVLTTMHADNAFGAITRLREMGIPPFLLADGLLGILSVRLARKICPHCRREVLLPPEQAAALGMPADARAGEGAGCEECRQTGYRGRTGVYELLVPDGSLRRLIAEETPVPELAGPARDAGWRPMGANAAEKVRAGIIPAREAIRLFPELRKGGGHDA